MIARALVSLLFMCFVQAVYAGNTTWMLKIVDDSEQPISGVRVFWKTSQDLDWKEVTGFVSLGANKDGGGFQTAEQTIGDENFRQKVRPEVLRLELNYYFRTAGRADWGFLKIVQPDFSPVEMRVSLPNDYVWQRVELVRRSDVTVGVSPNHIRDEPGVQNRIPPARVEITVFDCADQRLNNGPPLAGALVEVRLEGSGQTFSAHTNGSGIAQLEVPTPGRAEICISKNGFGERRWRTRLEGGRAETQMIQLLELREKRK